MSATEIPLLPAQAQQFAAALGGVTYRMRLAFDTAQDGCWILDIGDVDGNLLAAGIPLVSGGNLDLLAQYRHLGFAGSLVVTTDRGAGEVPTFDGLGVTSHLYWVPDA